MHEADMRSLGIADGEVVDIIGDAGDGVERSVCGFRATRYNIPHTEAMQSAASAVAPRRAQPCASREINSSSHSEASGGYLKDWTRSHY
jgi:anaerobic selenocysteine-containing dehydrogenase